MQLLPLKQVTCLEIGKKKEILWSISTAEINSSFLNYKLFNVFLIKGNNEVFLTRDTSSVRSSLK